MFAGRLRGFNQSEPGCIVHGTGAAGHLQDSHRPSLSIHVGTCVCVCVCNVNILLGNCPSVLDFQRFGCQLSKRRREKIQRRKIKWVSILFLQGFSQMVCSQSWTGRLQKNVSANFSVKLKSWCHFIHNMPLQDGFYCEWRQCCLWWELEKLIAVSLGLAKCQRWQNLQV